MKLKKRWVLGIPLLIAGLCLALYLLRVNRYQRAVREIDIVGIDAAQTADGTYFGECDVDFIRAKVEVTVEGGRIAHIRLLEHYNDRGAAAEAIPDRIVAGQRIDVDVVAGATNSSRVIQKAVENALQQGHSPLFGEAP